MRILEAVIEKDWTLHFCQELVRKMSQYEADVWLTVQGKVISMKSILGLCSLVVQRGDKLEICVVGYDEDEAAKGIKELLYSSNVPEV